MTLLHKNIASFFFKLSMVYSIAFAYLGQSRSLAYNGVVVSPALSVVSSKYTFHLFRNSQLPKKPFRSKVILGPARHAVIILQTQIRYV